MLTKFFPELKNNKICGGINKLFSSKHFAIVIALLTLLSNLFSLELPVLYAFALIVVIAVLFCDDLFCAVPMACCSYFTFSRKNNPLSQNGTSVFLEQGVFTQLMVIVAIVAVFAITRLLFAFFTQKQRRKTPPKLTLSFAALGLSYVLGGCFSGYYGVSTAAFGFLQIAAISFSYFFFFITVDPKKFDKEYFAYLMTVIGILLCGEILGMLHFSGFFTSTEGFQRGNLYTGWGIYNNVAGAMIMCLPAPFYYAATKKHGWRYLILGNVFLLALLLTQSRGGILFGLVIYAVCVATVLLKTSPKETAPLCRVEIVFCLCAIALVLLFSDKLQNLFMSLLNSGMNDSGRFKIYANGLLQFLESPLFGNGFYACDAYRWGDKTLGSFLPARYHNTFVQLLASGGVTAFCAYLYHRAQTVRLLLKKSSIERYFMGLCILGLLLTSLLDCHFFNFGPGFTYSALLLFMEIDHRKTNSLPLSKCKNGNSIFAKLLSTV